MIQARPMSKERDLEYWLHLGLLQRWLWDAFAGARVGPSARDVTWELRTPALDVTHKEMFCVRADLSGTIVKAYLDYGNYTRLLYERPRTPAGQMAEAVGSGRELQRMCAERLLELHKEKANG